MNRWRGPVVVKVGVLLLFALCKPLKLSPMLGLEILQTTAERNQFFSVFQSFHTGPTLSLCRKSLPCNSYPRTQNGAVRFFARKPRVCVVTQECQSTAPQQHLEAMANPGSKQPQTIASPYTQTHTQALNNFSTEQFEHIQNFYFRAQM